MKVLFLLKKNEIYNFNSYGKRSSGLWNSSEFIVKSLISKGISASILECDDNNDIDRLVTIYAPDVVIIEALWVVPSKMRLLMNLHPKVWWAVHLHSHIPFLASEGIAIQWINQYLWDGIYVIANSINSYKALNAITERRLNGRIKYLENVYLSNPRLPTKKREAAFGIDIGCFGAIRPLKNQLLQAMAAIQYAKEDDLYVRFHMNTTRVETHGEPVLKNIEALFKYTARANLVYHPWYYPSNFIHTLERYIDISMQVSLSETFNIVTADAVTAGIPIVVSNQVAWASMFSKCNIDSVDDIVRAMRRAYKWRFLIKHNQRLLQNHEHNASNEWYNFIVGLHA